MKENLARKQNTSRRRSLQISRKEKKSVRLLNTVLESSEKLQSIKHPKNKDFQSRLKNKIKNVRRASQAANITPEERTRLLLKLKKLKNLRKKSVVTEV